MKSVSFSTDKYTVEMWISRFKTFFESADAKWCDLYVTIKDHKVEETVGGEEICSDEVYNLYLFLEDVISGTANSVWDSSFKLEEEPWEFTIPSGGNKALEFKVPIKDTTGRYKYSGDRILLLDEVAVKQLRDYLKEITKEQRPLSLVCNLFDELPPDYEQIVELLDENEFTADDLSFISYWIVSGCVYDYNAGPEDDEIYDNRKNRYQYAIKSLKLLIEKGLDVNHWGSGDENAMFEAQYCRDEMVGPCILKLLLENGGNPNINISGEDDEETLFEYVNYKIVVDDDRELSLVRYWLLLMAYGGKFSNGEIPLELIGDTRIEDFKEFQNYRIVVEELPDDTELKPLIMHVYSKDTNKEVARMG